MPSDNVGETRLLQKLRAIEALFAGATTTGERVAAAEADGWSGLGTGEKG